MKDDTTLTSKVLEKIPNKYLAVIVASKRARAINDGERSLVKSSAKKHTTIALEEIAAGVVVPGPARPAIEGVSSLPKPQAEEAGKELPALSEDLEYGEEDEEEEEEEEE